jgi:hypothetical protein
MKYDELLAASDIADLLGVTDMAVSQWQHRDIGFPEPTVRVARGRTPLWTRTAVLRWARRTGRLRP